VQSSVKISLYITDTSKRRNIARLTDIKQKLYEEFLIRFTNAVINPTSQAKHFAIHFRTTSNNYE